MYLCVSNNLLKKQNMKTYYFFLSMMLIGIMTFLSSCSDDENVFYYSFKDIEYSVYTNDGMTSYETNWEAWQTIVNRAEDQEISAGSGDIYQGHHEYYYFECDNPSLFNPTVGHVHVPLPQAITLDNQISFDEKEGEYSLEKMEVNRSYESRMYDIPAKTKLTLERKIEMKKLTLTYTATFQRHPSGKDHVVTGKFIRYIPVGIALVEKYEPLKE